MTLHLVRLGLDLRALAAFAVANRIADDDGGYALHRALRRRFGAAGPQPFRAFPDHRVPHLLGYAGDAAGLADAAALPVADDLLRRVFPALPELQPMPDGWRDGARYGFEVRARPVVRFGGRARAARSARDDAWQRNAGEIDAYVAACERVVAAGGDVGTVDPADVYGDWLRARLAGAATLDRVELRLARRARSLRSTHGSRPGARTQSVEGPDTVMAGTLTVGDPAAFARLLAGGVGRHAAFGYGMLLLSPPGRDG